MAEITLEKAVRTLNVKLTNRAEIAKHWGYPPIRFTFEYIYVGCNSRGFVNWKTAKLYYASELITRNNVKIIADDSPART